MELSKYSMFIQCIFLMFTQGKWYVTSKYTKFLCFLHQSGSNIV